MNELTSGAIWNKAAIAGLLMAAVTIAFTFTSGLTTGIAFGFLNILLWLAKLVCCIMLFRFFMLKFSKECNPDNRTLYHYGLRIAICSSLLVAAYTLLMSLNIDQTAFSEAYTEQVEKYMSMMNTQLDSNGQAALEQIQSKLPVISFFSMLIYCFLWGLVLSSIFSKSIAPEDPFTDNQ